MSEKILLLLLLVFLASPVHAMVYTWTDVGGVTHFTNKEYEIPARYRARTKARYPEQSDSGAQQQTVQTAPQAGSAALAPAPPPPAPAPQTKPEAPVKTTQPVIAPAPQKITTDRAERRAKRVREHRSEDE